MRIVGHGIDIVDNARITRVLEAHGRRFVQRCFTAREAAYVDNARGHRRIERLAGRFAIKEACLKALGTGWRNGIAWTDLEILPDAMGRPILSVSGKARQVADRLEVCEWWISLSHTADYSTGSAIALAR